MAKTLIKKYDIQPLIDEKWESDAKPYRSSNIGASSIGCPCQRSTFLSFRWASPIEDFKGQMLRLFDVGTREEDIMVDNLKGIGFDIRYTGKDQLKMQIAPHVICRPDGVIFDGIPDIDEYPVNFEMKTMNRSNFEKLEKQGLRNSKPEYYDQAQCEMYGENTLSNAELLAIIIKSGTKEESSVTLAQKILSLGKEKNCKQDSFTFLQELSINELMQIKRNRQGKSNSNKSCM